MIDAIKLLLVPGSISFFVLGLLGALVLLYGNAAMQCWGRRWLTLLLVVYAFLATPVGADAVAAPLTWQYGALGSKAVAGAVDTVVTLTTGVYAYRAQGLEIVEMGKKTSHNALETARVYRLLGHPTVIATGGIVTPGAQLVSEAEVLRDGLVRLAIPPERIVLETRSHNTREQAEQSAAILRQRGVKRFVLITDAAHMPRAIAEFRRLGLDPIPSVSIVAESTPPGLLHRLRPNLGALQQSDWACYEYGARIYYWFSGRFNER
jgi:uncharacterized SAM-binding protein YcdF (DUF218 family)